MGEIKVNNVDIWTDSIKSDKEKEFNVEKVYSYNEAIDIAGNGLYVISLMIVLSLTLLFMCIDLFSFSVVVSLASCDFHLTLEQKGFLISIPFIGPVIMAYAWGYISDTVGRRKSLLISMTVSFVMSTLCALAPNWIVLAIFKLIGTCFVSCAQSATCTLLGESCPERIKNTYIVIMTSLVHLGSSIYITVGYFLGGMDPNSINIAPWRLLTIILAAPLGLSALALLLFHESPKFLLNADREEEALYVLSKIYERNGNKQETYPVQKIVLDEAGNVLTKNVPLLLSLKQQTLPLFKPPLLWNTMLLYYIAFVVYSSNSGFYIWLPFISKAFSGSTNGTSQGLCELITTNSSSNATESQPDSCKTTIDYPLMIAAVSYGCMASILHIVISRFAARKKLLMISIVSFSCLSCFITQIGPNTNFFYFGILTSSISLAPFSTYYVDLYPTSFRGMASCLGVMVARFSSTLGINVMGPFIMSQCTETFYGVGVLLLSGVLVTFLLPADKKK